MARNLHRLRCGGVDSDHNVKTGPVACPRGLPGIVSM